MTAELDAHWINVNFTEEFSATTARDMEAQYRAAGKDSTGKRKTIFSFGTVLKEGEAYDSPRVKAETGPVAMMMRVELPITFFVCGVTVDSRSLRARL